MRILFNGKTEEIPSGSVSDLLQAKALEPRMVSVEINEKPVDPDRFSQTLLTDGDRVEVLFFMGGGA